MEGQDWAGILGGILASLGAGFWANANNLAAGEISWASWIPRIAVLIILLGALLAYISKEFYGGAVARGLTVIGAGFGIYAVTWWPHKISWHGGGTPAWLGIIEPAWQTFFHLLTVITLGIVGYGFYLFWKEGQ